MHGIVHFDLPAKNPAGQGEFYNKMFGWKTEPSGDYLLVTPPEGLAGGLDPRGEKPVLYIEVDSIPETLKKIEELDGKTVLAEMKIDTGDGGDYGKIGLFADPEGTLLGLWSK
jgi:uncharacterized protein